MNELLNKKMKEENKSSLMENKMDMDGQEQEEGTRNSLSSAQMNNTNESMEEGNHRKVVLMTSQGMEEKGKQQRGFHRSKRLPLRAIKTNIQVVAKEGKRKKSGAKEEGEPMEEDDWEEPLQKLLKKEGQKRTEQGEL